MDFIGFTKGNSEYSIRLVRPIFYENGKFYKRSVLKSILKSFITSTDDANKIEKEIMAFKNRDKSYISSVIDYSKADNFEETIPTDFTCLTDIKQCISQDVNNITNALMIGENLVIAGNSEFIYSNSASLFKYQNDLTDGEVKNIIHILESLYLSDECLEFIEEAKANGRNIFSY